MKNKIFSGVIVGLLIILILFAWNSIRLSNLNDELAKSLDEAHKLNDKLDKARREAFYDQGLLVPEGLDEHYERIRNYESYKFTSKGDPGWLVMYATQVLHDLGNYTYTQRCTEFVNRIGASCGNFTSKFLSEFEEYVNESLLLTANPEPNASRVEILYNWVNDFVQYTNDTDGFGRFPIETLTCRYGDCEDQAMALTFLLESEGYETALCIMHDKNLTEYGSDGLYHVFCVVRKNSFDCNGTTIELKEYKEYGSNWLVLDPAFNSQFGEDPEWMEYYREENGTITIPSTVWSSLRVTNEEVDARVRDLGIVLGF